MARYTVFLAGFLTMGCGFKPAESYALDPDMAPEHIEIILSAFDTWPEADPSLRIPITIEDRSYGTVRIASTPEGKCSNPGVGAFSNIGWNFAPEIVICPSVMARGPAYLRIAAMHEMGHGLAARSDHLGPGNVMSTGEAPYADRPTPADVSYVKKGRGLE